MLKEDSTRFRRNQDYDIWYVNDWSYSTLEIIHY